MKHVNEKRDEMARKRGKLVKRRKYYNLTSFTLFTSTCKEFDESLSVLNYNLELIYLGV